MIAASSRLISRTVAPAPPPRRRDGGVAATEAADHDVPDGPVHGIRHELGQDGARGTHQGARDDEHRVADDEARHGRRGTREGVQQADDDGHVRAADGQHQRDAEDDRGREDDDEEQVGGRHVEAEDACRAEHQDERAEARDAGHGQGQRTRPGLDDGGARIMPWSLAAATIDPENVMEPMTTPRITKIAVEIVFSGVWTMRK